jgi:RNA ligase
MLVIRGRSALQIFRDQVSNKPEITEKEIAPGFVCFTVQKGVSVGETYSTDWHRECRGIVFSKQTGDVVSRPLHKFFNIGERDETQAYRLDWSRVVRVMEKRDGSMVHTVKLNNQFRLKTKASIDTDVAKKAEAAFATKRNLQGFTAELVNEGYTVIFEFTSPSARIVIGYPEEELQVLHVRHDKTGVYMDKRDVYERAYRFGIKVVDEVNEFKSFDDLLDAMKTRENIEGWIVQFDDGDMVKFKTEWYLKRHRVMTYYRERDIAELILDEQIDDIKSLLQTTGVDIAPVLEVEAKFSKLMNQLISDVDALYRQVETMEPRDAAAHLSSNPLMGLVMSKVNKKDVRYEKHFRQHMLKQHFGLDQLGSLTK